MIDLGIIVGVVKIVLVVTVLVRDVVVIGVCSLPQPSNKKPDKARVNMNTISFKNEIIIFII